MSAGEKDLKISGEEFLYNVRLYRVKFPDFWQKAYGEKNGFYAMVEEYAGQFVEKMKRGEEYLEGDKIQHFWHEHCFFCWNKAATDAQCVFYCTEDMQYWICEDCFEKYRQKFGWGVGQGEELCGKELHCRQSIVTAK